MDDKTKKKICKIVKKMHGKEDSSYNNNIIQKNYSFLDSVIFMYNIVETVISLECEEEKKLVFLMEVKEVFGDHVVFYNRIYSTPYSTFLHEAATKNFSLKFFNGILDFSLKKIANKGGYSKEIIDNFINIRDEHGNTFVHIIMDNLIKKRDLDYEESCLLKSLIANLNFFNYNFLLPSGKGRAYDLCTYIDDIDRMNGYLYKFRDYFYEENKDANLCRVTIDKKSNQRLINSFYGKLRNFIKLEKYIQSYRKFDDKKYSYTVEEFARCFRVLLEGIDANYYDDKQILKMVVSNVLDNNHELLMALLNECIDYGCNINSDSFFMNSVFMHFYEDAAFGVYKFICSKGFNTYNSNMADVSFGKFNDEFEQLYQLQMFMEYLKKQFFDNNIKYDLDFYSVYDEDSISQFSKFIDDALVISNFLTRYQLADQIVEIIKNDLENNVNRVDNAITIEDILNSIKKIVLDRQNIYLDNIESYKQKVLNIQN